MISWTNIVIAQIFACFFLYFFQVKECHDRYVVTGDEYKELRETVVTTVLSEKNEKLHQMLQVYSFFIGRIVFKFVT